MELPKKLHPKFITKTFFPEYGADPSLINRGHYYDWAYVSYCLYPTVELWSTPSGMHAWVQIGDRFYDSETVLGKKKWWNLAIFKSSSISNVDEYAKKMTLQEFKECWNHNGRYWLDQIMWENMRERVTSRGFDLLRK